MGVPAELALSALTGIGSAGASASRQQFSGTYVDNPIILLGGIAGSSYTSTLMISAITQNLGIKWQPMVGGKLVSWQAGTFPFGNQAIAGNAMIMQPLPVSMIGTCPADSETVGYLTKNSAVSAFAASLNQHINLGGLFSVRTPAFTWVNCLLLDVADASQGDSRQAQYMWRFDFLQPLITLQSALAAQNALYSKLGTGAPVTSSSNSGQGVNSVAPASVQ